MRLLSVAAIAAALAGFALCTRAAEAADLRVIASPSLSGVFAELVPGFERATGNKLVIQYGLTAAQKQHIEAGDFDLAITPTEVMDAEIAQGKIDAPSRADIARTGLALGNRAAAPKPRIATVKSFRRAMLKAHSVAYLTDEASGQHVQQDFAALGIADAISTKTVAKKSAGDVWKAVASGEAELGIGFMPNVLTAPGVAAIGLFPPRLQFHTGIAAGIGTRAQQRDAAKAFIAYLRSPHAAAIFKTKGFEQAKPARVATATHR